MHENTGALAGVKVVDLSRVWPACAKQILGDHGADIIKIGYIRACRGLIELPFSGQARSCSALP